MGDARTKATILAVDDDEDGLFALERLLQQRGFDVITATSGAEALTLARAKVPDLILLDLMMPGMSGHEVTATLKQDAVLRYTPIILLTARGDPEDAIQSLDQGADDFVRRPFNQDELIARVNAMMRMRNVYRELKRAREDSAQLRRELGAEFTFQNIVGNAPPMREVFSLIEKVADADVPVLITGESGTGKELVAHAIHNLSARRERAFVVQNCSAFNENLLESELFGHVRGAFTGAIRDKDGLFAAADGGTFFLDELGEMSAALQVKLLRVLQDGTFMPVGGTKARQVDVRVVAATHRDLSKMVQEGKFREDLFYRLHVIRIHLPPLRERKSDIPQLVQAFLAKPRTGRAAGGAKKQVAPGVIARFADYHWPGNIRELQNEIERLVLLSGSEEVIAEALVSPHIGSSVPATETSAKSSGRQLREAVEALERELIVGALARSKGNKSEAARELGVSRSNLIAKVQAYGLGDGD